MCTKHSKTWNFKVYTDVNLQHNNVHTMLQLYVKEELAMNWTIFILGKIKMLLY